MRPRYKCLACLLPTAVFLALVSCAPRLPPISARGEPFQMEANESELWHNAEQLAQRIDKSGMLYADQQLEAYLNALAQKLVLQDFQAAGLTPRIKVLQHPLLNAFALPHGVIYLHTGILARMENEAQLATVLGHELTHVTHRHTVQEMLSAQNKAAVVQVLSGMLAIAAGVFAGSYGVGQSVGQLTGQVGDLWALTSVRGYGRELESEADEEGLRRIVQAGYDPKEALRVFELLQQDLDEHKITEPFFFGTHPRLQERMANYRRLLGTRYAPKAQAEGQLTNAAEFLRATRQLLLDNAVLDLRIGRFQTARAAIEKHLQQLPHSPRAYFFLGEVYRRSGQDDLPIQHAITAYREAVRLDSSYADPERELGLLYRTQHRHAEAHAALERYLMLRPEAVDAPIIRGYLAELEKP